MSCQWVKIGLWLLTSPANSLNSPSVKKEITMRIQRIRYLDKRNEIRT